ncbi:DUF3320 domain-containing protein [Anaerosporobacter sp.]
MKKITVETQINETIHYALQQNCIPIINSLVITNTSKENYTNITVKVSFQPEFAVPYESTIKCLKSNEPVELSPIRIVPSMEYLVSLTEKVEGKLTIEVKEEQKCIWCETHPVRILAYDQWAGINYFPEMIAAYITPFYPKVNDVVEKAIQYLKAWGNSEEFTGYKLKNPDLVEEQMKAIYKALQDYELELEVLTESYETNGQSLYLPQMVIEEGKGSSLELSLLYASCLESVGLNPILVFFKGYALAGCHIEEEYIAECVEDDVTTLLTKKDEENDSECRKVQLIDCTDIIRDHCVDFIQAKNDAKNHICNTEMFLLSVDIKCCRTSGICPLPLRILQEDKYVTVDVITNKDNDMPEEFLGYDYNKKQDIEGNYGQEKLRVWERKLLDLSLRNTLLNFRKTKTTVQLMTANLFELEDQNVSGEQFTIMGKPKDIANMRNDLNVYPIQKDSLYIEAIATSEFVQRRIRTFLEEEVVENVLKNIHRQARSLIEENGANSLYLSFGFLRWYETKQSQKARYAPLVLVPIDLVRKAQSHTYAIRIRDEEIQMNITLLEMLRQDYGIEITGLDPLPTDESGVDLSYVFREVRKGIANKDNWAVEEYAFLGLFSFNQFILWNDIRNRTEELMKNKLVASLISGKLEWEPQVDTISAKQLDEQISPMDLAVPISADSSQLEAICAANKGHSFVLHGPPGTGKSQTITNIIADALFHGKTVLFVAEKMAALSVVQKRLERLGIAPFCLELHSNKAQKREVLKQLSQVLQVGKTKASGEYSQVATKVHTLRQDLNQVIEAIHKKREYGMSLFEAISRYETYKQYKDAIVIEDSCIIKLKEGTYEEWLEGVTQCKRASEECEGGVNSVFKRYGNPNYSLESREYFAKLCKEFGGELLQLEEMFHAFEQFFGTQMAENYTNYKAFADLLSCLSTAKYQLDSLMLEKVSERKEKAMYDIVACGKEFNSLDKELGLAFDSEIYQYDVNKASLEWSQASSKWFLRRLLMQNRLIKEMRMYTKSPIDVDKHTIAVWYNKLMKRNQLYSYLNNIDSTITGSFSYLWQGMHTNWEILGIALQDTLQLRSALSEIALKRDDVITATQKLGELVALHNQKKESLKNDILNYLQCWQLCMTKEVEIINKYQAKIDCFHEDECWIAKTREELLIWLDHMGELRDWSALLQQVEKVRSYGLNNTADAFLSGKIPPEELIESFICNLNLAIIKRTILAEPILTNFQGVKFEDTIKKYKEVTEEFEKLTTEELVAKLSSKIPNSSVTGAASSELGILQKAIRSGGRMLSIRKLFDQTQNLIARLCPCMLMSPMSASQYLDPALHKFDLVIFDEASQLPTCEAVGAIARGENAIIVGDPKQLPPTRFFRNTYYDEENYELEDLESVLDDCLAITMPQKHLLWHYRSRHESLIAYSNAKYYGHRLYTYPSPDEIGSRVKLIPIEGYYDKGGTKQNRAEALAVVREICTRLLDENKRKDSIGVVTFSCAQASLIEDLLDKEFCDNEVLEQINEGLEEPIFIKNLENVQGDERDVILFSVGYGPDKDGKVSMNFGPLNREGGYRRLNVAISRARKEMQVYSTITPEQIDLTRTHSEGVAGLKGFLTYARNGKSAISVHKEDVVYQDTTLIEHIAKQIENMGYKTRCNVGWSMYTIDIGVIDPKNENSYILGILLDGYNAREVNTARERNLLQPQVLTDLGWNLHSIWILDWLDNQEKVLSKVKASIDKALLRSTDIQTNKETNKDINKDTNTDTNNTTSIVPEEEIAVTKGNEKINPYESTVVKEYGSQDDFYQDCSDAQIRKVVMDIIKKEAPISKKLLTKKVVAAWNITRLGSRVENRLSDILHELRRGSNLKKTLVGDMSYYWRTDQNPEEYIDYRVANEEEDKRSLDDIPPYEIANAMKDIIASQISLSKNDMIRETAKVFGFSRIGAVMEAACVMGIDEAERRGYLLFDKESERIMIRD